MKKILVWVAMLLLMGSANASTTSLSEIFESLFTQSRSSGSQSRVVPLPTVSLKGKYKPIRLNRLDISVNISGPIAQTTYEMIFYNPNKRILEGELKLPLLDGQSVVGYALSVNGKYRESVVVDKAKAKKVYENTVRKNIDPGIIEKTIGNNYKLRLYPLPAKGYKSVKVTVEELLHEKNGRYRYLIPFVSNKKIPGFSLHVEVVSQNLPIIQISGAIKGQSFKQREQGYFLSYKEENMKFRKPIALSIEKQNAPEVYVEKSKDKRASWFMAVLPKSKTEQTLPNKSKSTETIGLVWDTSLSSRSREQAKELAFLDHFFLSHRETTYKVLLSTLDINMHKKGIFRVENGNWQLLKKTLQALRYNGAKDFSKLRVPKGAEFTLLFSNGVNTFSDDIHVKRSKPIFTLSSSPGSDSDTLKYIAKASKGKYIDLSRVETDDAVQKLFQRDDFRIIKHSRSIYDTTVKTLGESVVVLGRIKGEKGKLTYVMGDKKFQIDFEKASAGKLISRVWASAKIDTLSLRYVKNRKKIISLSETYKIVSRYTSMIILDRVEDYVRYEIVPPIALRKRYDTLLKAKKKEKQSEKKRAIEESIALLKEEKIWYRKKFPIPRSKYNKEKHTEEMGGDIAPVEEPSPALASRSMKKKKSKKQKGSAKMGIDLKEWNPNASYIKALKGVPKKSLLKHYFKQREAHMNEPSFYVDMADYFQKKGMKQTSLLILSNLLELDFEKSEFIRVFAFKLLEYHRYRQSIYFFKKVRTLRPFELQSTRDLALAYERVGKYQTALNLHYWILSKIWDSRFSGAKIVTLNEFNHIISRHRVNTSKIDRRLIAKMPVDIRIVINWSTDNTDMDLWVIDPEKEKTYYGNKNSRIGGKISNDMTRGYGPEEFMLKKAIHGKYVIKVKYYGTSQQKLTGPTVIRAEVYTHYGKKSEKREEIVFRVEEEKEVIDLGSIHY
jgi:hypothetical protein